MKKYICFIEFEGFAVCDSDGNFIRTTLESGTASELSSENEWKKWLSNHPTLAGTIFTNNPEIW